jgi:hypothetical protein
MGVQVHSATKNGQGDSLSILNRQFISFRYGGKNIEDFDLLAVFSNDRLDKEIYAPFNDTTTEQAELDGQMFWRSNFKAGQLSFTLATDGMTARQLEDFKEWFQPGIERELILSEYHNRAILARIASTPHISLLPFEKEVNVQIGETFYPTKTSLYKGEIKLDFVMDDPYWYSVNTYIDSIDEESLKLIYEDGIPHVQMFQTKCFLANNQYIEEKTVEVGKDEESNPIFKERLVPITNSGIDLLEEKQKQLYLYYCGTAPSKPELSFDIELIVNERDYNKVSFWKSSSDEEYYYLNIGGQKLKFSLPSLLSSYNKAIDIVLQYKDKKDISILDIRRELRDSLYNYYTRSYVISLIDIMKDDSNYVNSGAVLKTFFTNFIDKMPDFLPDKLSFSINCKNGKVTVSRILSTSSTDETITENAGNMIKSNYLTIETRKLPKDGLIKTNECLLVETNTNLLNLKIDYKYMYL